MRLSYKIRNCMALVALAVACVSCSAVTDAPGGECPEEEMVTLSFKMLTDALTRADAVGHGEADSEFRDFEEGIDMKDLGIFLFAARKEGASMPDPENEKLVVKLINTATSTAIPDASDPFTTIIGTPGAYTVTLRRKKAELESLLGISFNPNADDAIIFRVLILANCSSAGTDASAKWGAIDGDNYKKVIEQLGAWHYAMGYIYNENGGDDVASLYTNKKKNIPMFGTRRFAVSQEDLFLSRPDRRIYFGNIDLLRALAKVRVVDNIQNKDAEGYPKIIAVSFEGSKNMALQLPYAALDYQNGEQVHTPNIYEPDAPLSPIQTKFKLGTVPDAWNMTPAANRRGDTRVGYVPEQKIGYYDGNVENVLPKYKITIRFKKLNADYNDKKLNADYTYERNEDGTVETEDKDYIDNDYLVPMKVSANEVNNNILRNHVYTLSIDRVAREIPAEVTWSVEDWNMVNVPLDYTKNLIVTDPVLDADTYAGLYPDGRVVMKPWTATGPDPLKISFVIQSPVGISWKAFLLSTEGTPNAFAFLQTDNIGGLVTDDNGNNVIVPSVSGIIDGHSRSFLNIVTLDPAPDVTNYAKLQVVVTLADGTVEEVNVVDVNKLPGITNYTIVQSTLN